MPSRGGTVMNPPQPNSRSRITLLACMLLIAAFAVILAATRNWGRGRWLFVLLVLAMGMLHRAIFTAARMGRGG